MLYELELSEQCADQPDLVDEKINQTTGAVLNKDQANRRSVVIVNKNYLFCLNENRECNTWHYYPEYPWLWNHTNCPDPCLTYKVSLDLHIINTALSNDDPIPFSALSLQSVLLKAAQRKTR